jgi:TonB-dependent starch-binding outer membrane protein SusC
VFINAFIKVYLLYLQNIKSLKLLLNMKKELMMLLLAFCLVVQAFAQTRSVKGKVTDADGRPLAGATVNVKFGTVSTSTDADGNFQINVGQQDKAILVVTYVGYSGLEVAVKGGTYFPIRLEKVGAALNDVIVVGYGQQRKRDVTGSISTVKADEIAKRPLVRVEEALQGTTPGVAVQDVNGNPGSGLSVRIRGASSINGGNDPLYVIDGYIGAPLESIDPSDIEDIQILKDASATAIYGSRASNGVVLITTKSGHEGAAKLNASVWVRQDEIPKYVKLMDAYDFAVNANLKETSSGGTATFTPAQLSAFQTNKGTNWQKAATRKPIVQNYDASISGGSQTAKYYFSMDYLNQPGLLQNEYYNRATLRSNLDFKVTKKLDLKFNVLVAVPKGHNNSYGGDGGDPYASSLLFDPTSPVRDPVTGQLILQSQYGTLNVSPVAQLQNQQVDNNSTDALGTGSLTYHILPNLSFTSTNSYETNYGWSRTFMGLGTSQTVVNGITSGYANNSTNWNHNFVTSNFLTYNLLAGDHSLTLVALTEFQTGTSQNFTARSSNLSTYSLGYYNLALGGTEITTSGYGSSQLQSYMGRLNYGYKDKYLLTASIRDDGSSVLTKKYSTFPSVGLGWIISKERFMEHSKVFSLLKLRATYGLTGNQAVGAYSSIQQINTSGVPYYFDGVAPAVATPIGSPVSTSLKWETTKQTNIAIESGFFNNRLLATAEVYDREISNLLYNYSAPGYLGGGTYPVNIGGIRNRGVELSISGSPLMQGKGKVSWNTHFEISFNDNKILNLSGQDNLVINGVGQLQVGVSVLKVGHPLGEFNGYKFLGTWKTSESAAAATYGNVPGDAKYLDVNKDNTINTSDYSLIGNGIPKYTWGFINDFQAGRFSLTFMIAGQGGSQIYSQTQAYLWGLSPGVRNATTEDATKMWTPENETNIPHYGLTSVFYPNSSRFVYSANFMKLKNLSLTYNIPETISAKAGLRSLDVYVSGQNLITLSHYPGADPEVTNAQNALLSGVETAVVPNPRSFTVGVRIGF